MNEPIHGTTHFRTDRLVALRKARGISSKDLGEMVGIRHIQMSRIANGKRGVTGDVLYGFAVALNCSTDFLLGLSDDVGERTP